MYEWELGMANQARSALATVWSFRGHELKDGKFDAARIRIFRAEMFRNYLWRQQRSTLTVTETAHLRSIVAEVDKNAFVVLSPVQGVFGRGFSPLGEK